MPAAVVEIRVEATENRERKNIVNANNPDITINIIICCVIVEFNL